MTSFPRATARQHGPAKTLIIGASMLLGLCANHAYSHGYVDYPKARQQFCVDDAGYWWPDDGSNIPNAACRAAFLVSGTVPFTQHHEFSANVDNFRNIEAVKAKVSDGNLCAAGDSAKRGMNLAHIAWQKTAITPDQQGQIELRFMASTPHNPSFWEFYLSRPGFDVSSAPLGWNDLELIDSAENVAAETVDGKRVYRLKINLPAGRSGDAILFTRWQRDDAAGEGFYNCSDVTLADGNVQTWYDKGYFIDQGSSAKAGDEVWFRVFNSSGQEHIFEKLAITTANQNTGIWAQALVTQLQQAHAQTVQVGKKNANGEVQFSSSDLPANKVWLQNSSASFALDIKAAQSNLPPTVSLPASIEVLTGQSVTLSATAIDPEGDALTYHWQLPSGLTATSLNQPDILITAGTPSDSTVYTVRLSVKDASHTVVISSQVSVKVGNINCQQTDPNAANHPAWQASKTYVQGDKVSHKNLVWQANWWNNSEPSQQNTAWQLLSAIAQIWQAGNSYNGGAEVDHKGRAWRAKWWTSEEPKNAGDWVDIGPASCP